MGVRLGAEDTGKCCLALGDAVLSVAAVPGGDVATVRVTGVVGRGAEEGIVVSRSAEVADAVVRAV